MFEGETIAGYKTAHPDIANIMEVERIPRRLFPVRKVPTPTFDLDSAVGADHPRATDAPTPAKPSSTMTMNENPDKKLWEAMQRLITPKEYAPKEFLTILGYPMYRHVPCVISQGRQWLLKNLENRA